jgi:hypothetical protein
MTIDSIECPRFQEHAFDSQLDKKRSGRDLTKMNAAAGNIRYEKLSRSTSSGFQIIIPRKESREIPEWAKTQQGVRTILLTAFPRLQTSPVQRQKAGRWAQVIQLHFQMGWTWSETADEMGVKPNVVLMIVRGIKYTAEGKTWNGAPRKRIR